MDLNLLIEDFSKPPKGATVEELKEQASTTTVFKDTIRRYINIFLP